MKKLLVISIIALSAAGCSRTEKGAVIGGAVGAGVGGAATGSTGGAIIGGAIGAGTGAIIGRNSMVAAPSFETTAGRKLENRR